MESPIIGVRVPELKKMTEEYLLGKEKALVETFQNEIDVVPVALPLSVVNFFSLSHQSEEKNDVESENSGYDELEQEILAFLEKGPPDENSDEDETVSLLSSLFSSLL